MAKCPKCGRHFKVPEDEHPAAFGCPNLACGYKPRFEPEECPKCGKEFMADIKEIPICPHCNYNFEEEFLGEEE